MKMHKTSMFFPGGETGPQIYLKFICPFFFFFLLSGSHVDTSLSLHTMRCMLGSSFLVIHSTWTIFGTFKCNIWWAIQEDSTKPQETSPDTGGISNPEIFSDLSRRGQPDNSANKESNSSFHWEILFLLLSGQENGSPGGKGDHSTVWQKALGLTQDRRDPADELGLYSVVDPHNVHPSLPEGHSTCPSGDGCEPSRIGKRPLGQGSRLPIDNAFS